VLLAAHEWGCPPWEITGDQDRRLTWYMRWLAYAEQRTKRQEMETAWQTP